MYDTFEIDSNQQPHPPAPPPVAPAVVYDDFGVYDVNRHHQPDPPVYDDFDPSVVQGNPFVPVPTTMTLRPAMLSMNSTTFFFQEESPPSSPPPKISSPPLTTSVPFALSPSIPSSSAAAPIIDRTSKIQGLDDYGALDPESFEFGRKSAIESMIEMKLQLPSRVYAKYEEESCPSSSSDSSEDERPTSVLMQGTPKRKFDSITPRPIVPILIDQQNPPMDPDLMVPCPLSPDALTAFSKNDPNAIERNKEVTRATDRLIHEIVPLVAKKLSQLTPHDITSLNFSIYFHSHGVNIRHMGLIRSLIPPSHITNPIRTALLLQLICRTLKNITRDYQRRWMKSEQSTSEQGMYILLIQILNLVMGSHVNSEKFWTECVIVGIIQRYGGCAIDRNIDELQRIRKLPQFLKVCTPSPPSLPVH